jgi:putative ABC transport system ATP-binding protein
MAAVEARGVTKCFGNGDSRLTVLDGVDWSVEAGELTFLAGESGSGKTTLLSILAGILRPDAGTVRVFGEPVERLDRDRLARFRRERVGFVFQQFNLVSTVTAAENVAVPLLAQGIRPSTALPRVREALERVGLGRHADRLPRELSGGQQQRVAIARALVHSPRLLVCDEPTASLDARNGRGVIEMLREVALDPRRAVIVVTHDSRIFPYADRICHIDDGRLVADRRGPLPAPPAGVLR